MKSPDPIDVHVGGKIRARRNELKMSQQTLAAALGLTFQQVQKYEKGTNRVGASRLQQIANTLLTTPAFFFEGAPGQTGHPPSKSASLSSQLFGKPEGVRLTRAFLAIGNSRVRRAAVIFLEQVACAGGAPAE